MSLPHSLDVNLAALKNKHPGWRIWFVPHAHDGSVTWCAQPEPTINTDSPEHLSQEIELAEKDMQDSPSRHGYLADRASSS
jgi:hypothetical protein